MILHANAEGTRDITEIVSDITWQGSEDQLARKLEVKLINRFDINAGDWLIFKEGSRELFRGTVFTTFKNTEDTITPCAFDNLIYFEKSKDDYKFTKTTDKLVIETLCKRFNIPIGAIEGSKTIDKLLLKDKGLAETIKELGAGYNLYFQEGQLYREQKGKKKLQWLLDDNVITDAELKISIDSMKNSFKVIEGSKVTTVKDDKLIEKYGLLQDVIEGKAGKGVKDAQERLKESGRVSREISIDGIGFNECTTGVFVEIKVDKIGLKGLFEIISDNHSYSGSLHRMSLTLKEVIQ